MSKPSVMCKNALVRHDNRLCATLAATDHRGWKEGGTLTSSTITRISEGAWKLRNGTGPRHMHVETQNTLYIIPSDNFLSKEALKKRISG